MANIFSLKYKKSMHTVNHTFSTCSLHNELKSLFWCQLCICVCVCVYLFKTFFQQTYWFFKILLEITCKSYALHINYVSNIKPSLNTLIHTPPTTTRHYRRFHLVSQTWTLSAITNVVNHVYIYTAHLCDTNLSNNEHN